MVSRVSFQGLYCTILVSLLFGVYNCNKMGFSSGGGGGGVVAVCLGCGFGSGLARVQIQLSLFTSVFSSSILWENFLSFSAKVVRLPDQ